MEVTSRWVAEIELALEFITHIVTLRRKRPIRLDFTAAFVCRRTKPRRSHQDIVPRTPPIFGDKGQAVLTTILLQLLVS